jgi:hypothetical protein
VFFPPVLVSRPAPMAAAMSMSRGDDMESHLS